MPRFRLTHTDHTATEEDAARLAVTDASLCLQRPHQGVFTTVKEIPTSDVVAVERRNTELNGTWSWTTVWTNPDPSPMGQRSEDPDADS